jgi:hypothetical protein
MTIVILNKHTNNPTFAVNCSLEELKSMRDALQVMLRDYPDGEFDEEKRISNILSRALSEV